jgi:hypothetical protein
MIKAKIRWVNSDEHTEIVVGESWEIKENMLVITQGWGKVLIMPVRNIKVIDIAEIE